jgi:outer membrane protein TolC
MSPVQVDKHSLKYSPKDTLTLSYCYERIQEHYPLARKTEIQQDITDLRVRLANTGYYPQIELTGNASYQSEVTRFPAGPGGINAPLLSKDQYRVSLDVTQSLYAGGAIGLGKRLVKLEGAGEEASIEVQLHELRAQVDEVYFGILLARQQLRVIELLMDNLKTQLERVKAQVNNGVQLPSQGYTLEAELLQASLDSLETEATIRAGVEVLGTLIGRELPSDVALSIPSVTYEQLKAQNSRRPEMELLENTKQVLEIQKELAESQKWPKVSAFGSLSYGRPGYNILNDNFHEFYMVGLRVRWDFRDWSNSNEEQSILSMQQQKVKEEQRAFNRQISAATDRIHERILALQEQIKIEQKVIALRQQVAQEAENQLQSGVITAADYVTELNRASQAELALYIHRVQLSHMLAQYATVRGIPLENVNHTEKVNGTD